MRLAESMHSELIDYLEISLRKYQFCSLIKKHTWIINLSQL